jgi:hypothetical protein
VTSTGKERPPPAEGERLPAPAVPAPCGYALVVGPDGAGKSSLLGYVDGAARAAGVSVVHAHYRPGRIRPGSAAGTAAPHRQVPRPAVVAAAKVLVVFLDHAAAWCSGWGRQRRRGILILERGWHDMLVDPVRYRLPRRVGPLVRALGGCLPRADVVLLLSGDPVLIDARKPEIGAAEVARQLAAWRGLAARLGRAVVEIDTTSVEPAVSAARAWDALRSAGSWQWRKAPLSSRRVGMRVCGQVGSALTEYRPARRVAAPRASANAFLIRRGLARRSPAPLPPLGSLLDQAGLLAAGLVATRSSAPGRWLVGVEQAGAVAALLKVGQLDDELLRHEADVLTQLSLPAAGAMDGAPNDRAAARWPRLRWSGEWQGRFVLATDWIPPVRRSLPALPMVLELCHELVAGRHSAPLVHGDLAPWNLIQTRGGLLAVDWEYARSETAPLYDLAHFVVQSGALLRRYPPSRAVSLLCSPGSPGDLHLQGLGVSLSESPRLVLAYLDRWQPAGRAIRYHARMRQLLARSGARGPHRAGRAAGS